MALHQPLHSPKQVECVASGRSATPSWTRPSPWESEPPVIAKSPKCLGGVPGLWEVLSKVLKNDKLAALLIEADEDANGGPFDQITKLQLFIQKSKSEEGLQWVFFAVCLGCASFKWSLHA